MTSTFCKYAFISNVIWFTTLFFCITLLHDVSTAVLVLLFVSTYIPIPDTTIVLSTQLRIRNCHL